MTSERELIKLTYYLSKYVGTYRVLAEIDKRTNDFCRDEQGNLDNDSDIYISCEKDIRIFHYGKNILWCYIPSIKLGNNIIKELYGKFINPNNTKIESKEVERKDGKIINKSNIIIIDNELYEKEINNNNIFFDFKQNDDESEFKFKSKDIEKIFEVIKPNTSGASISPFSPKNLKGKRNGEITYQFSKAQIEAYKEIINNIPEDNKLLISKINKRFLVDILCKKAKLNLKEIKADMKKEKIMKIKDYIYFKGYEKDYLKYLKKEIEKYVEN